jgi:hypothetical protein
MTQEEFVKYMCSLGLNEAHARAVAAYEGLVEQGSEENLNDEVLKITGRPPIKFSDFVEANKSYWMS